MPQHPTSHRRSTLTLAIALFALVTTARMLSDDVADGITFLYIIPIAVSCVGAGLRGGLICAAASVAMFESWVALEEIQLTPLAHAVRCSVFLTVGALVGHISGQLNRALAHAQSTALHFELSHDMLCIADHEGRFVDVNGSWETTLGWTSAQLTLRPFIEFVHPEDREQTAAEAERLTQGLASVSFTNRYLAADGSWRFLEWNSRQAQDGLIYAVARDVTRRHLAEAARREAEERFRHGFEDSSIAVAIFGVRDDDSNRLLEANEALARLLGTPREELIGITSPLPYPDPDDRERIQRGMRALAAGELSRFRAEVQMLRADGKIISVEVTSSIIRDAEGRPLYRLSQLIDVTARRAHERELRRRADHDSLTGLLNRHRFESDLREELENCEHNGGRGAVLMVDLDDFKPINDRLGHATGDDVIRIVARALTQRLRTMDLVARIGGDEFVVLLRRVGPIEATHVAEELTDAIEAAVSERLPAGFRATASIGVAAFDGSSPPTTEGVLRAADAAMYAAKSRGGNQVAAMTETTASL